MLEASHQRIPSMMRTRPPRSEIVDRVRRIYTLEEVKAEKCRRSFYYFEQEFWPEVSTDEFKPNWHIEYLCNELMKIAQRVALRLPKLHDLIINVPPGTTKSITASIMFPVWCWIKWYWMRFISSSYSAALSLEHAELSRDLVRSSKFQRYFPELEIKQDKDTKSNFRVQKRQLDSDGSLIGIELGGNRYSTSVGGTLTGFHGHLLIVDDPLDPQQAVSEVKLKTANTWLGQTLSTRKVDKAITPTILIMQRLHQNDPTGYLLAKRNKSIKHICLPGEIKMFRDEKSETGWSKDFPLSPRDELLPKYKDDLLDPTRMSWKVLHDMETDLGQYGYAGQVGQRPTPPGGGMFKVDHFSIIDKLPLDINFVNTIRYWDKAGTAGSGAYTAGVKMTQLRNGKFIVHDVKRGQWSADEREHIVRSTAEADERRVMVYMEQEPGSGGKESAESSIRHLAGFVAQKDRVTGDKVYRADPYSVQVNEGNVLLLRGEWNQPFIEEHRFFPFGTYKDQVDAAAGAFNKLTGKRIARSI